MTMNTTERVFRGWLASLSNGETIWETPTLPGEKSAWQKLIDRLSPDGLHITRLRVQRGGITIHALPNKACDGYYHAYEMHQVMFRDNQTIRQGCGSIIGDKVYITWIDQNGNIWQDIRPLESEKIHTTLRDFNYERNNAK